MESHKEMATEKANKAEQSAVPTDRDDSASIQAPGAAEHARHEDDAVAGATRQPSETHDAPKPGEATTDLYETRGSSLDAPSIASSGFPNPGQPVIEPVGDDRLEDTDFIQQPIREAQLAEEQDLEPEVRSHRHRIARPQRRRRSRRRSSTVLAKYVFVVGSRQ